MVFLGSLRRLARRLRARQRGASALEFAIVAPLALILIFLSLEVAIMLVADASLESAASRIVRQGKIHQLGESCETKVMNILDESLSMWGDRRSLRVDAKIYKPGQSNDFTPPDPDAEVICDAGGPGDMVVYRIRFERPGITGVVSFLGGDFLSFERIVVIQNEP